MNDVGKWWSKTKRIDVTVKMDLRDGFDSVIVKKSMLRDR
jgi:hypothetical protein